jgi:hypothetical protein
VNAAKAALIRVIRPGCVSEPRAKPDRRKAYRAIRTRRGSFSVIDNTIDRPWNEMAGQAWIAVAAVELNQVTHFDRHMLGNSNARVPTITSRVCLNSCAL